MESPTKKELQQLIESLQNYEFPSTAHNQIAKALRERFSDQPLLFWEGFLEGYGVSINLRSIVANPSLSTRFSDLYLAGIAQIILDARSEVEALRKGGTP